MNHIVYLDTRAKELQNLTSGRKNMIARGSMGRKVPYKKVSKNDILHFIENKGDHLIKARAKVADVYFSEKLTREDSFALIDQFQKQLLLNTGLKKRFAGKRYLTLITISEFEHLEHPLSFDKSKFGGMSDWIATVDSKYLLSHPV